MSMDSAVAFVDRVDSDDAFARELEALRDDPEAVRTKMAEAGFDATPDEVRQAVLDHYGAQLTQEQLDAIAAGADPTTIAAGVVGGTLLVGVLAVTAAAFF
jgi:predicted ribosomally synthesized peptide with nif11-like leader